MLPPFDQSQSEYRVSIEIDAHPTVRYLTKMTPRERQVLECVDLGLTNIEIGARLHITSDCVKYHLKSIFAKLGARRRTQAVCLARQFELLTPRALPEGAAVRIVA